MSARFGNMDHNVLCVNNFCKMHVFNKLANFALRCFFIVNLLARPSGHHMV